MGHGKIIIQEAQSVILSYVPKQKYSEECMNNTVENDFFGFLKVKRLHPTGEVDKYVRFSC